MFQSPIANTADWNFDLERMQVPVNNTLRYPGYALNGVKINGTTGQLLVPVKSYIKIVQSGTESWLELEPLLVRNPALARRFETGFPVIYMKTAQADPALAEGLYNAGDVLGNVSEFSLGIQYTDRVERDIAHSCTLILAAMQGNVNTDSWSGLCDAIQDKADISFLRINGSAITAAMQLIFESGGGDEPFTYIPGITKLKDIINGRAGSLRLATPGSEANIRYLWVTTNAQHQTRVSYERASIVAETRIILLADLFDWFAPQSVPDGLPRFTTGNRLTYFTNGPEFFDDIFKEIREAATDDVGAASRFFLAGYSMFDDIKLINKVDNIPQTLEEAAKSIVEKAGHCYFLPLQLFEISGEGEGPLEPDEVIAIAALVALVLAETGLLIQIGSKGVTDLVGVVGPLPIVGLGAIMVFASILVESGWTLEKIQGLSAKVDKLDFTNPNNGKSRKIFAVHPAHWDDNPHQGDDSLFLVGLSKSMLRGTTSYHQKIASVKNTQWVSYCGGLDFNKDRMDDAKHMNTEPFHDVHAKVTGAAAADIAITFIDRWNHENSKQSPGQPDDQIDIDQMGLPQPPISPVTEGDIVQVARTNFKVNPANGAVRALPYAQTGDRTILDTLLLAIANAKEYIYIEDQFLAPPKAFRDALLAAIDNGLKSLVIMLPSTPEQIYGETHRERFIDELLLKNAGREVPVVRVGYPRRHYTLPNTSTEKLIGRVKTGKDMLESDTDIFLGPVSRIPAFPFYISVAGEIMLVTGKGPGMTEVDAVVDGVVTPGMDDSYPKYQQYRVERGTATNHYDMEKGCAKRAHRAGTPVTVVVFSGIYVHAKCMLVDDVFLSIGSANMNRRGLYADAEANVFSVPTQLRFSANNPVRELRKELWAAHLNLPISMGKVLLEDPVSASRLFDRRADSGNRFVPYKAVSNNVRSSINKIGNITIDANSVSGIDIVKATAAALLLATEAFDFDEIYFHASDPSSFTEDPIEDIDV